MNRIRELRKQKDMTQKELAKHLQVSDSTLSYWEMGKYEPDSEALMKLSRFFQVPIDFILGGDFIKWDIDEVRTPYPDVDTPRFTGSAISVSEPGSAYSINNKSENTIAPAAVDNQLCAPRGPSIPDTTKPATPAHTTYGLLDAQAAFIRSEFEGLTQGETDMLAEYAAFIKLRRKK